MKRFLFSKSMLCLFLLGMVCHVAWAQTYAISKETSAPSDGCYAIYSESSSGNGWVHYNGTLDRKFRVATDVDLTKGIDADQPMYIWKLVNGENNTFTLQCMHQDIYMPADDSRNKNMQGTTPANFTLTAVDGAEGTWFISQTNYTNGGNPLYIHTNAPGGYPNLSYWDSKSAESNSTSIRVQFYKVDMEEKIYTFTPTTRATRLESGKKYMIYNTTFNGTEDRTGFLFDNGSSMGHSGSPKVKPNEFKTSLEAYLWEVEATDEEGKYYLKAADGSYVNVTGANNNETPVALYIQPWNTSTATKAEVKSEGADGTVIENANIGNDVFTISGTKDGNTGRDCWNGNPDTFAMWESAHPFAFYEVNEEAYSFADGMPFPGRTYYIYCDNDNRQYLYNDGGALKVSAARTEWSNEFLFTCSFDGQYFQFQNLEGKYLAHKGLQNTAYNFELKEYTLNGKKHVALFSIDANKYFVLKNDNTFDQADNTFDAETTDFSTSFIFEEYAFPKNGETYFIYSDTYVDGEYVNRYMYADGGNLKLNTTLASDASYQWTCIVTNNGYVQFRNGNGKYLKHKGVQDTPYNFTVNKSNANHAIAATLYSVDASRYFVVANNGNSFDQATKTYDQTTEDYCTDFVFIPMSEAKLLTIVPDSKVTATATWNGETKALPASWTVFPGTIIANSTLSISCRDSHEFIGLFDGETALGKTTDITSLNESRTITAKFAPAFFSSTVGEKWINIVRKSNANHAICLGSAEVNTAPTFNHKDYTNTGMMWCFVGNAESFKIYNYISGNTLALTPSAETIGNGTEVKMVAATEAQSWHLITYDGGYAIAPVGNNSMSLNSYGGDSNVGKNVKFYTANDNGSQWAFDLIDTVNTLTMGITVDHVWESSPRVAELTFGIDGNNAQTRVTESVAAAKYYLPKGVTLSLSNMTYRGYTFNGIEGIDNLENFSIPEGGLNLNVSYTANDERILFYSPSATGHPYRIPAIATAPNGDIFAICDHRPCGNDIGYGEVDLVCRVSSDNGVTWTPERRIADGLGHINDGIWKMGFGDPAIVADCERNEVLVMSVCGNRTCWDGNYGEGGENENPNRVARLRIKYDEAKGEWVYGEPEEVTYSIYPKFKDAAGNVHAASLFIGAGKICQSRIVKKGDYYRLYCSVWVVTKSIRQHHNYVIYSDDFGETWEVLGDLGYSNSPVPAGNEPKCEELPDGTVVVSSRVSGGRFFNLFTFSDNTYTTGSWGQVAKSTTAYDGSGNGTNGEIYKINAINKETGETCDVMLQSVPAGPGRRDVKIYYKEMEYAADGKNLYTPETFAADWKVGKQVSFTESAYSTMILQADGRLAFFFEEVPGGYCMVYIPFTIEEVTDGKYTLNKNTTEIIGMPQTLNTNGEIYDLSGRRVEKTTKGVYIVNGKKVVF